MKPLDVVGSVLAAFVFLFVAGFAFFGWRSQDSLAGRLVVLWLSLMLLLGAAVVARLLGYGPMVRLFDAMKLNRPHPPDGQTPPLTDGGAAVVSGVLLAVLASIVTAGHLATQPRQQAP